MSANELVTGWWEGRQLGLIKFLAGNGRGNGVAYSCDWLFLRGWGFDFEATPARHLQAIKDLKAFPSSLQLTAWRIGAWPVLPVGTQTAMSLGIDH